MGPRPGNAAAERAEPVSGSTLPPGGTPIRDETTPRRYEELLRVEPDGEVLRLHGEVDLATAPKLERALRAAIDAGHTTVLLDCSELTFLDATGLSVLIRAQHRLESDGVGRLLMRAPSRAVRRLLDVAGVADSFILED